MHLGTEDNGYLHRFFTMLNTSKDTFETACVQVHIPDTIVLNMGIIVGWFFTSKKDGFVRRKKRTNTTKENVAAMLHTNLKKNVKTFGLSSATVPAATVTYNATDADGLKIQNVMYLMENEVEDFLRHTPVKNCLVQQWVHPCGNQNSVLHCLWTPSGVQISRRNARNLLDDRAPAAYRLATYESGAALPADISLCTSTTKEIIKNTCNHIVEHLSIIALSPASMTTYWKISSDLRVVLLWCSQFTKVGERKHWHSGPSVSPTIQLSNPQTQTDMSMPICPFCKSIAGIETSSTLQNPHTTSKNAVMSMLGDCGIKTISFGVVHDFCLKRGVKLEENDNLSLKTSNHQWKVVPREFRSLHLGYNVKQFNSQCYRPEFRQKTVSVCEKCYNKYTASVSDNRVAETELKLHGFGNSALAILPPTFCSAYTVHAYDKHFERLRGSDARSSKIKLAIRELSRVWNDDIDDANDVQSANNFHIDQLPPSAALQALHSPTPAFPSKSEGYRAAIENEDSSSHKQCRSIFLVGSDFDSKNVGSVRSEAGKTNSRPDEMILQRLQRKASWQQNVGSSFRYSLSESCPILQVMFTDACKNCKRTTNEQKLRGFSLSMAEWLNYCKYTNMCTLMPLKTSNCIAAFIYVNKHSLDPNENLMNFDEFGSAMIFLSVKSNEVVIDDFQMIPDGKSCSGVVLAGVKRFLAGINLHVEPKVLRNKRFGIKSKQLNEQYFEEVAELDTIFDSFNLCDEDILSPFELWQAIPTIPRIFARVAASDSSVIANMGDRSSSVSMQEWLKLCEDLGVVKNLPLKRSDCVKAFTDAIKGKKSHVAQEMNLEQFSQGLIFLAMESGIWGDISASKPSASSCSDQIVRGVTLMLKELLTGNDLSPDRGDALQLHALSQVGRDVAAAKQNTSSAKSVVITAPMWQDVPMVIPLFNKVCRLSLAGFGNTSKRSKSVSMREWLQMCDECKVMELLPLTRADCISAFLYSNKCIISDEDVHELNLIEFCQSLIFLAAKSGILGNVDLSCLPSAASCNDDVSRGVNLLLKEARMDQYVRKGTESTNLLSARFVQQGTNSNPINRHGKEQGPANAAVPLIPDDNVAYSSDSYYSDNDFDGKSSDDADDRGVVDDIDQDSSEDPHCEYEDSGGHERFNNADEACFIDEDDGDTLSCDTSRCSSMDLTLDTTKGMRSVDINPLWVIEPGIEALFRQISGGSLRIPIMKLLQHCNSCHFLHTLQLSKSQFMSAFASSKSVLEPQKHGNSDSVSLTEFCQGLIAITCNTTGSLRVGTNIPSATSCSKLVARSVIEILKRTNMLTSKDTDSLHKRDATIPKLQIPPSISTWLHSESAATHRLKVSPLFTSQHKEAPKQKTLVDVYAGASSRETSRLQRRNDATVGSQSARSAPVPPMQAKAESHGARTARFLRKL